jgi:7,8-dihydropterin-6-yl-methyl-4-(beta-D-ribofuranosyl)aminobenzene 5'-phosphate synthase
MWPCWGSVELLGNSVPLHAILGGYHLATTNDGNIRETVADPKALDPTMLLPGHCTGWRAKFEIEKQMPGRLVPCTLGAKYTI